MNSINTLNTQNPYVGGLQMNAVSGASGMVPPVGSTGYDLLQQLRSTIKQNTQDFKSLGAALNGNDLSAATQAFASAQTDIQTASQAAGGTSPFDPNSPIGKDFQAIGDALNKGDLAGAKQAYTTFKQDMRSAGRAARARHHHHAQTATDATTGTSGAAASTTSAPTDDLTAPTSSDSSLLDILA